MCFGKSDIAEMIEYISSYVKDEYRYTHIMMYHGMRCDVVTKVYNCVPCEFDRDRTLSFYS